MAYSIRDIKSEIKRFGKHRYIRGELHKRGWKIKDIARELGVSDTAVQLVMEDKTKSRRIARKIEELLELPYGTLFEYTREG